MIKSQGYTLIEVLMAILIFSTLVFLATFAFTQGMKQYEVVVRKGLNFFEETKLLFLERNIASATDYFIADEKNYWFPYFIGRDNLISYVSLSPLAKDIPVIAFLEKKQESSGKFSLVYYEIPVYTLNYKEIQRIITFKEYQINPSLTILSDLEDLKFQFYTYDTIKKDWVWSSEHKEKTVYLPRMVKISYLFNEERVHYFFGIHTDSTRKVFYNELFGESR
ncbi:MAG: type II secretion system protein J [Caldimicrobium sp.]